MKKRIIALLIVSVLLLSGCTSVYENTGAKGYRVIDNVEGVTFDVYESILQSCTFSTGISDTDQLNNGSTLVYKNGTTDYLAYNSTSYAIVVQKIESLGLNDTKDKTTIKAKLSNLYFLNSSVDTKASGISYKTKKTKTGVKYMTTKQTEVGVAPNVLSYQNYYGYLSYIETISGEAYVIFMGTVNPIEEVSKDVNEILLHTVASLNVTKITESTSEEETTSVGLTLIGDSEDESGNESSETPIVEQTPTETPEIKEEEKEPVESTPVVTSPEEEIVVQEPVEEEPIKEEPVEEIPVEIIEEPIEEVPPIETTPIEEEPIGEITDPVTPPLETEEVKIEETVKEETPKEEQVKEPIKKPVTDTRKPLIGVESVDGINKTIMASAYNGTLEESIVDVTVVSLNSNARDKVRKYEDNFFEPKDGCHFEMIEYTVNKATDKDYVDIKVVGLDHAKLTYSGLKYTTRTYDLIINGRTYVYYEIPNGCKEYVLQFGNTVKGYDHIKN